MLLSPALAGASPLWAQTIVYNSGGFEAPRFSTTFANNAIVGNLHGQDAGVDIWKESTTDPAGSSDAAGGTAIVQASGGGAGLGAQDVLVTRTQYDNRWAPIVSLTPTTQNLVSISWNMQVNQSSGSSSNFGPFFGIEANDDASSVTQIAALGVDATTGQVLVYDQNAGGLNTTPGDASVAFGQFNSFLLTLDYTSFTYAVALNGETIETGLPFYGGDVTQFTDADIAALQDAPSADANQSGSAIFDNYLITNSAGSLPVPNVVIATGKTLSASTDAEIGTTGAAVEFAGGTLTADGSFATARPILVDSTGGNIAVLPGTTFTLNSSVLTWSKGTLATANAGVLAFALNSATVSVQSGSALSIAAGSSVTVAGNTDPFTDSNTPANHVAIVDNGSLAVNTINSSIAGMTGSGQLTIGTGSTTNKLQLATGSGASAIGSLTINAGATLDIANNHLFINYGAGADPKVTILSYLKSGYNNGAWNGPGIDSSAAAASGGRYAVGFADAADNSGANLTSGQIEVAYTLYGDANLDGVVNSVDFGTIAANFGKQVSGWDEGDFDYNGVVNSIDFGLLAANFGKSAGANADVALPAADWSALDAFAAANGLLADVPEPASATLLLAAPLVLLPRRRKSWGADAIFRPASATSYRLSATRKTARPQA
ncbi:MAG TPA: hypothetical protein VHX86_06380 [Tepidisphaeraceae bacterium]|nr:hypothetical protein [Tepidisphaeraceae bacterium]